MRRGSVYIADDFTSIVRYETRKRRRRKEGGGGGGERREDRREERKGVEAKEAGGGNQRENQGWRGRKNNKKPDNKHQREDEGVETALAALFWLLRCSSGLQMD